MCLPCSSEAMKAVATLLEQSRTAWLIWNFPSGIQPSTTAATAARKPTTVAWTWKKQKQRGQLQEQKHASGTCYRVINVKTCWSVKGHCVKCQAKCDISVKCQSTYQSKEHMHLFTAAKLLKLYKTQRKQDCKQNFKLTKVQNQSCPGV